ncbi:hypothetical protein CANCADRAFT_32301 [Tortispora caseinolytica NRRL Y-17796]|uniref:Major facilitator superfamily (MFS) profile domain-containing protein n=1 Tax=Tortispora caseinolytica NRRL Y-17796 TaxID=767744 RepID=A0A1E4TB22_9ASCO|nr:hypothetical protein CANCADRAFT_32301 [Tortispora caseinolytica NRRL Y-17796]
MKSEYPDFSDSERNVTVKPRKWYERSLKIGKWQLYPLNHSFVQLIIVAFVCFLCPGMFNALSGLGGAGQLDPNTINNASTALYCTFATIGFFAGTICNIIGVRACLFLGSIGYAIYSGSLLCYSHTRNSGFTIFAGALLGVCAALLWTAQGVIMMSYPTEGYKGRYIGTFWAIFNLGAVIGALIPLAQNIKIGTKGSVKDSTYATFLGLICAGIVLSSVLLSPSKVVHDDGSPVQIKETVGCKEEIMMLYKVLKSDTYILWLFPMFFASNWFYTYQFNDFNLALFNVRTRSLNNVLYWTFQIIGALIFGFLIDLKQFKRRSRAIAAWVVIFAATFIIWGFAYLSQTGYDRITEKQIDMNWTEKNYSRYCVLYIFFGIYDSIYQSYCYWLIGALTNDPHKLALFAGFLKGIQSAGAAIVWRLDAMHAPYMNILASTWTLLGASLLFCIPIAFMKITDTTAESLYEDADCLLVTKIDENNASKNGH